mmetsp:Transcript_18512/g.26807  ORF Transcript_18512/g.26807 Transcript_18512/m.26807 type:complete len:212 (-) Transcript_18512:459-1094(-)
MMQSIIRRRAIQRSVQEFTQQSYRSVGTTSTARQCSLPLSSSSPCSSSSSSSAVPAMIPSRTTTPRSFSTAAAEAVEESPTSTKSSRPRRTPRRNNLNPIILTESAASRLKQLLTGPSAPTDAIGIRLGVKRRGCNGLSYTLNYASAAESELWAHDEQMEAHGVKIFIEPMALMNVVGTKMDWEEDELTSEFTFTNPNAKGECGCGESFNV